MNNFNELIANLDLKLFEKIESQSSVEDKQSLLACQFAVREIAGEYKYLEIGSYLGGSIQPFLLDERCKLIYSIDKRPLIQADERGVDYTYLNNSTERMLENLKKVAPEQIEKIQTVDSDTKKIEAETIKEKFELCLIDGEHTDEAVMSDFKFCLNILSKNGAILFDDANVIYNGIANCINYLEEKSVNYRAYCLPNKIFVIEINEFPLHQNPKILDKLTNNHKSYIYSLQSNDYYRKFVNKKPFQLYRKLMVKMKGLNKFD